MLQVRATGREEEEDSMTILYWKVVSVFIRIRK
jgi:hypothetical protein